MNQATTFTIEDVQAADTSAAARRIYEATKRQLDAARLRAIELYERELKYMTDAQLIAAVGEYWSSIYGRLIDRDLSWIGASLEDCARMIATDRSVRDDLEVARLNCLIGELE